MNPLGARSYKALQGVHPDLVRVVEHCAAHGDVEFIVIEGVRTLLRQGELVKVGASQTMKSRHLTGHAVDLAVMVDGDIRWDWPMYHRLAEQMKISAGALGIPIECGADWTSFPDGPHFQLPWREYPDESSRMDWAAA